MAVEKLPAEEEESWELVSADMKAKDRHLLVI